MSVRVSVIECEGPFCIGASHRIGRHRRSHQRSGAHWAWVILVAVLLTAVNAPQWAILGTGIVMAAASVISRRTAARRW